MAVSRLSQQSLINAFPKGNTIWDGTTSTSSMDSLGSVLVTSNVTFVTFSNLPQTYSQLRLHYHVNGASLNDDLQLQFNNDTSSNYSKHWLGGNGTSHNSSYSNSSTFAYAGLNATNGSYPAVGIIDIYDYASTIKAKTLKVQCGSDRNNSSTGVIYMVSGSWFKNSGGVYEGISTVKFYTGGGSNITANSRISLYGVK